MADTYQIRLQHAILFQLALSLPRHGFAKNFQSVNTTDPERVYTVEMIPDIQKRHLDYHLYEVLLERHVLLLPHRCSKQT